MKVEIYLNNNKLEINDDIDFVINKQFAELSDLTTIIVDYSKTISIPMTNMNNKIFNNVFMLSHQVLLGVDVYDYDPSKKIPMTMTYNSSVVMGGYAVLNKVNVKNHTYEINIFGQLGRIFSELKERTIGEYNFRNDHPFSPKNTITMNRYSIIESFDNYTRPTFEDDEWTNYYGFAPQLIGENFINGDELQNTIVDDSIINFKDLLTGDLEPRRELVKKFDINEYGEIRSYTTRPYFYVERMINLVKDEINNSYGYKMLLDPHFFNVDNPYVRDMVYFPGVETNVTDDRSIEGNIILNDPDVLLTTFPQVMNPTIKENNLSGYSVDITDGEFSFTNNDGSNKGNIIINATGVELIDQYDGVSISPSDVNKIAFAFYNHRNENYWPVRYMEILDEDDNLVYRLILSESILYDIYEEGTSSNYYWRQRTSHDLWKALRQDMKNIIPDSVNEGKVLNGTTFRRTLQFNFSDVVIDKDKFKFRYGCFLVDNYGKVIRQMLITDDYYPQMFTSNNFKHVILGTTHTTYLHIPNVISVSSLTHRSGCKFSIIDIVGADFVPFTWLLDYVKKFRLFFDIDYTNKSILLTDRYFHDGDDIVVEVDGDTHTLQSIKYTHAIVDYSKGVEVEPLINKYKTITYGYEDNESNKGIQYKKYNKVNYGDIEIDTGISINEDKMELISDDKESVMIPTVTNAFAWTSFLRPISQTILPTQILQTNKVINTLDNDKGIQYFPFYAFRDVNKELIYDEDTPQTDKIRVSDDTVKMTNTSKYCYLPATDRNNQSVIERIPQFDNYIVKDNITYWSTFTSPKAVYNGYIQVEESKDVYNSRWKNYLGEIFNINNKKITCWIKLTYPQYINFKFSKFLVIDNTRFLVNRIIDFSPNDDREPTKVELIQISSPDNLS